MKLGIVIGSLREGSYSSLWAKSLAELYPSDTEVTYLEIGDLPFYNEDIDQGNPPAEYTRFRDELKAQDLILFVTPEYNRSMPAVLKNAIDVGSRPYGQNAWDQKPALIVSHSVSGISGFGANHHLRQALTFVNMPTVAQPEVYLAQSQNFFDENGVLNNDSTRDFLQTAVNRHVQILEQSKK